MTSNEKIKQWKELKKSKKFLDNRLKDLRSELITYPAQWLIPHGITIQYRDTTTYDESNVWSLMHQKGIPDEHFTHPVIDEGKLEQLYYDGILTDSDLRYIRKPQTAYALVEIDQDVQK